jgi:hypothetical protein
LKQRPFEPPVIMRKDADPVVAFDLVFVNRVPESVLDVQDSLIVPEEPL